MGYLHIDNLYKDRDVLYLKEVYALEKIHGTSAHISFKEGSGNVKFFSGGVNHASFVQLFNQEELVRRFEEQYKGMAITIYGEAYGGSCQKMSNVYGKELRFVAFDVKIGDCWIDVQNAHQIANNLGFEFVDYVRIATDLNLIDAERDKPSVQAERNGMGNDKWREGVILRPVVELIRNNGKRLICKHKRPEARETATQKEVSQESLKVLSDAKEVADEWVTLNRLQHVLDKLDGDKDMTIMVKLIPAMLEDVKREGEGEIEWSRQVSAAIGKKTAELMKLYVQSSLNQ